MKVKINGELHSFDQAITITSLLEQFQIDRRKVAIECNREIVPPSLHNTTEIKDNDIIEVVEFIGGG